MFLKYISEIVKSLRNNMTDAEKEELLRNIGFRILRFQNEEVYSNLDEVIEKIAASCLS